MSRRKFDDMCWPSAGPGRCVCCRCGLEISTRGKGFHKRACMGLAPVDHPYGDCAPDPGAARGWRPE